MKYPSDKGNSAHMSICRKNTIGENRASFVSVILLLIATWWLTGNDGAIAAPPPEGPVPPEIRITLQDTRDPVRLRDEQVLELRLESNPSTGYRWDLCDGTGCNWQGADNPLLLSVGEPRFEPAGPLLGAPTNQVIRLRATREGTQDYQLVYHRPWEVATEPLQTLPLRIEGIGPFSEDGPGKDIEISTTGDDVPLALSGETDVQGLPSRYHWCEHGGCTPVKAQGSCGSCWTFGTVGALECNIRIQDGVTRNLAEQYLLSCNTDGWGCNGGWFAHDYHLAKKPPGESTAGAVDETDFPYSSYYGYVPACGAPHTHHERITSWSYVVSTKVRPAVADIKRAIYDYGPVAASVCVGWRFNNYGGGVFENNECQDVNHAIVLVGWDDSQGTQGVWYLRNSWGSYWGESGYMRIGYGICNVGYATNYIVYGSDRPSAPSNLSSTAITTTYEVDLEWDDNSDDETEFDIERSRTGIGNWSQIASVPSNVTAYRDAGLSVGVYLYRVRAKNASDDYSGYTAIHPVSFGLGSMTSLPAIYSSTEHRLLNDSNARQPCNACEDR